MTDWRQFVESLDDSHPMTTDKKHIAQLCQLVEGKSWRILELGSHAGLSAAAMALAAPLSKLTAVDLCDTIPESARVSFWKSIGVDNIQPVAEPADDYLNACPTSEFDFVFHDADHGAEAFFEYLRCSQVARIVAIHDFEQLPEPMREAVSAKFSSVSTNADGRGRVLFVGHR